MSKNNELWKNFYLSKKYVELQKQGFTDTSIIEKYKNELSDMTKEKWITAQSAFRIAGIKQAIQILEERLEDELKS